MDTSVYPFDRAAIYQISVQGQVPPNWVDRLEGLMVTCVKVRASEPICTLVGELPDQVALASVLNVLHSLHLSVLSVTRIEIPLSRS